MNEGLLKKVPVVLHKDWEAIKELPAGGQAAPVLIRHRESQQQAVLKILKSTKEGTQIEWTAENKARLVREISILQQTSHPNIVNLIATDARADPPWYVSPLGSPLKQYWEQFRESHPPDKLFEESQRIVTGLLAGLRGLHEKGIVHRDIKPENVIMLDRADVLTPVLIDFGIAYVPEEPRITQTDGNTVANRFVAPAEALYGKLDDPPPWWDCLGIIWLWAWMLMEGKGPKYFGRYDPDYHEFIADDRCDRLRNIWRIVAYRPTGPVNAAAMIAFLNRHGLGNASPLITIQDEALEKAVSLAKSAQQDGSAEQAAAFSSKINDVRVTAPILGQDYDAIVARLQTFVSSLTAGGLQVTFYKSGDHMEQVFLSHSMTRGYTDCELLRLQCGGGFTIALCAGYQRSNATSLPFVLRIMVTRDGRDIESHYYVHGTDGALHGFNQPDQTLEADFVFNTISRCLISPKYWRGET